MNFIFLSAKRNILRNTRRTILSGVTIVIAATLMCVLLAFEGAMVDSMRTNVINHMTGNIRIRNERFTENERVTPVQFYIPETEKIVKAVSSIKGVAKVVPQTVLTVSIYRDGEITTGTAVGTDLDKSPLFFERDTQFLSGRAPQHPREAAISEGLAAKSGLKTGDKFTFMVKTAGGGTNGVTVTVSGVVYIGDADFNRSHFFVDYRELSRYMRMGGNTLGILVFTEKGISERRIYNNIIPAVQEQIATIAPEEKFEVIEWKQTNMMLQIIDMVNLIYSFMGVFFFLLASTVIFNTTMMSVLERKKEIGTLMSLGMESKKIVALFLLETTIISATATIMGVILGFAAVSAMGTYGLNLLSFGAASMSGYSLSVWIYPSLHWSTYALILILGPTVAVLTCAFPIQMVRTVQPAEALRTET